MSNLENPQAPAGKWGRIRNIFVSTFPYSIPFWLPIVYVFALSLEIIAFKSAQLFDLWLLFPLVPATLGIVAIATHSRTPTIIKVIVFPIYFLVAAMVALFVMAIAFDIGRHVGIPIPTH